MEKVKTKSEFYKRWERGEFGNKLRSWSTKAELDADPYSGPVTVRSMNSSDKTRYDISQCDAPSGPMYRYNEAAPDHRLVIQGEVCRTARGLELTYSYLQTQMKVALREAEFAYGLVAKLILQKHCWPSSYDDLMTLLDLYQDHTVEFSVYEMGLGTLPFRNTIIWEVRAY